MESLGLMAQQALLEQRASMASPGLLARTESLGLRARTAQRASMASLGPPDLQARTAQRVPLELPGLLVLPGPREHRELRASLEARHLPSQAMLMVILGLLAKWTLPGPRELRARLVLGMVGARARASVPRLPRRSSARRTLCAGCPRRAGACPRHALVETTSASMGAPGATRLLERHAVVRVGPRKCQRRRLQQRPPLLPGQLGQGPRLLL